MVQYKDMKNEKTRDMTKQNRKKYKKRNRRKLKPEEHFGWNMIQRQF
jgi:hypothetical protein